MPRGLTIPEARGVSLDKRNKKRNTLKNKLHSKRKSGSCVSAKIKSNKFQTYVLCKFGLDKEAVTALCSANLCTPFILLLVCSTFVDTGNPTKRMEGFRDLPAARFQTDAPECIINLTHRQFLVVQYITLWGMKEDRLRQQPTMPVVLIAFQLVPGHCEIWENESADRLTKFAYFLSDCVRASFSKSWFEGHCQEKMWPPLASDMVHS